MQFQEKVNLNLFKSHQFYTNDENNKNMMSSQEAHDNSVNFAGSFNYLNSSGQELNKAAQLEDSKESLSNLTAAAMGTASVNQTSTSSKPYPFNYYQPNQLAQNTVPTSHHQHFVNHHQQQQQHYMQNQNSFNFNSNRYPTGNSHILF